MDSGLTVGSQIYHDLISDPVLFIQDACFEVCQVLYDRNEEAPVLTDVTYYIEDYDGISAKWGLPPHIYIRYSTRWVENAWDNSGGNPDAVLYETKGVLYHELTHGYQYDGNQIPSYPIVVPAAFILIAIRPQDSFWIGSIRKDFPVTIS
jgi:hypothetical protein